MADAASSESVATIVDKGDSISPLAKYVRLSKMGMSVTAVASRMQTDGVVATQEEGVQALATTSTTLPKTANPYVKETESSVP